MTDVSLTKAALVEEVARVADLTKKHAEVFVDTVFRSIVGTLHRGEKIELLGFAYSTATNYIRNLYHCLADLPLPQTVHTFV